MRKAFLVPPLVLGLCLGLCGCGDPAERTKKENNARAENLADTEERFQTAAEVAEHRAAAREAAREFIEKRFGPECKIIGLHSSLAEGGTYRIAADVVIGGNDEILKLEAIRFFSEGKELKPYWQVVLLSASNDRVMGDPENIQRLRTLGAPKATPPPAAAPSWGEPTVAWGEPTPVVPDRVEPSPTHAQQ